MAEHFVSIFGTEKDKVNCPFYYKIGACRHGDRCARAHNKPLFSQTLILPNMYQSPDQILASAAAQGLPPPAIPEDDVRYHFDDFYEDVREEMAKFGRVDELHVCANLADHLAGNTYVKFREEEAAQAALNAMNGRWYAGRPVLAEFSPVTDFGEGKCRPFEADGRCEHGGQCHFMHLRRRSEVAEADGGRRYSESRPRHTDRGRYGSELVRERRGGDGFRRYDERRQSSRDYSHYRDDRGSDRYSRYDADRKKERDRDYYRGRRDSYERERSHDHERSRGRSTDRARDHDRYVDYGRSHRSSRDRRSS